MNLQDLIDFHTNGAVVCEAYAVTPGATEDKNKDIGKHYNKRAKWHRDAIALVHGLSVDLVACRESRDSTQKCLELSIDREDAIILRLTSEQQRLEYWRADSSEATCRAASLNERVSTLEGLLRRVESNGLTAVNLGAGISVKEEIKAALTPVGDGS